MELTENIMQTVKALVQVNRPKQRVEERLIVVERKGSFFS